MPWIKNPGGRVVSVPESNEGYKRALRGESGWSVCDPPADETTGEGEASASPEPDTEPDTGFPMRLGRKRGRPRKVQAEE